MSLQRSQHRRQPGSRRRLAAQGTRTPDIPALPEVLAGPSQRCSTGEGATPSRDSGRCARDDGPERSGTRRFPPSISERYVCDSFQRRAACCWVSPRCSRAVRTCAPLTSRLLLDYYTVCNSLDCDMNCDMTPDCDVVFPRSTECDRDRPSASKSLGINHLAARHRTSAFLSWGFC